METLVHGRKPKVINAGSVLHVPLLLGTQHKFDQKASSALHFMNQIKKSRDIDVDRMRSWLNKETKRGYKSQWRDVFPHDSEWTKPKVTCREVKKGISVDAVCAEVLGLDNFASVVSHSDANPACLKRGFDSVNVMPSREGMVPREQFTYVQVDEVKKGTYIIHQTKGKSIYMATKDVLVGYTKWHLFLANNKTKWCPIIITVAANALKIIYCSKPDISGTYIFAVINMIRRVLTQNESDVRALFHPLTIVFKQQRVEGSVRDPTALQLTRIDELNFSMVFGGRKKTHYRKWIKFYEKYGRFAYQHVASYYNNLWEIPNGQTLDGIYHRISRPDEKQEHASRRTSFAGLASVWMKKIISVCKAAIEGRFVRLISPWPRGVSKRGIEGTFAVPLAKASYSFKGHPVPIACTQCYVTRVNGDTYKMHNGVNEYPFAVEVPTNTTGTIKRKPLLSYVERIHGPSINAAYHRDPTHVRWDTWHPAKIPAWYKNNKNKDRLVYLRKWVSPMFRPARYVAEGEWEKYVQAREKKEAFEKPLDQDQPNTCFIRNSKTLYEKPNDTSKTLYEKPTDEKKELIDSRPWPKKGLYDRVGFVADTKSVIID